MKVISADRKVEVAGGAFKVGNHLANPFLFVGLTPPTAAGKAGGFCAAKRTKSDRFDSPLLTLVKLCHVYAPILLLNRLT